MNPWTLLRGGKAQQEEGLQILRRAYVKEPNPSRAMELGVSLLWVGSYVSAWEHFRSRINVDPQIGDNEYGMAGVAKWCLGEAGAAVDQWRAGLETKYARASGLGVRMPLLLFFASVLRPEYAHRRLAETLMLNVARERRIRNWPGPILKLIIGHIDEVEFQHDCQGKNPNDTGTAVGLLNSIEV